MSNILEPLLAALNASNWTAFFVVIAVTLILNLKKIADFIDERANRHRKFVEETLKVEAVSGAARVFLEEELNYFIFKKITGIYADATLREKLGDVIARSEGELSIRQMAKARQFIRMKRGKLSIVVTAWDRVWSAINIFMAGTVSLIALALFMLPGLAKAPTLTQTLTAMGFGSFFFAFAVFVMSEALPAIIGRRIAPVVDRLERCPPGDG